MIERLEELDQNFGLLAQFAADDPKNATEKHQAQHVRSFPINNFPSCFVAPNKVALAIGNADLLRVVGGFRVLEAGGHNVVGNDGPH